MGYEQLIVPVCRIGICGLIVYMTYIFFHSIFDARSNDKYFMLVYALAPFAILYVNTFQNSVVNLMVTPFILLAFTVLTFKISFNNAVSYLIIFFVVFSGGKEAVFVLLNRLLYSSFPVIYQMIEGPEGVFIIAAEQLIGYFILLFTIRYTRKLKIRDDNQFSQYLLIIPAASMFILSSFLYMDFPETRYLQILICCSGFLLYFSNIAVFIILLKYTYILDKIKYTEMFMLKSDLEVENYKKLEDLNKRNRRFIHDYHTFNNNIRMLAIKDETEKIVEIIDNLEGKIYTEINNVLYSASPILNAILNERVMKAEDKGVNIAIFVEPFINVDFIEACDMISMFGNLLDNAIAAAAGCEHDNRFVNVKLFMGSDFILVFYIENSFVVMKRKRGQYLTTKGDRHSHGLGIGICEALARRYGGGLDMKEVNGNFETVLTLSAEQPLSK